MDFLEKVEARERHQMYIFVVIIFLLGIIAGIVQKCEPGFFKTVTKASDVNPYEHYLAPGPYPLFP